MEKGNYALAFRGHPFGYEVQATAKLFIPGVRFILCEDGVIPEEIPNILLTERTENADRHSPVCLRVQILLHGRQGEKQDTLPPDADRSVQEWTLCRMLYDVLHELTGYTPPWGLLTGIRPVRRLLQMAEGRSLEEAAEEMQQCYRISDAKMQLALTTARIQQPILPHSSKEIGLYISVPFCPTRCSYCSFVSHSMETAYKLIPAYVNKLCEEIAVLGDMIRRYGLTVQSVYIGGGTPTSLNAAQLRTVMEAAAAHIAIDRAREYTVEAGRADTITEEKLRVIREMGATRISINPQTMHDHVLETIGRRHTVQQVLDAFETARAVGFDDINMDLIAGLPGDDEAGFAESLSRVMALDPESITVHTLSVKRSATMYQSDAVQNTVPAVERMAELAARQLPAGGWMPYYLYRQKNTIGNLENVGYAKPGKENLYNILIMDETQTILGAGCAASTKLIAPGGDITRVMNYKFPYEYIDRFDLMMEKKQEIEAVLRKMQEENHVS